MRDLYRMKGTIWSQLEGAVRNMHVVTWGSRLDTVGKGETNQRKAGVEGIAAEITIIPHIGPAW
jgi:hypothetical protein